MTSIFFPILLLTFFFNSDYFDLILKNCSNRIFSHVPHYSFVARILRFAQCKDNIFWSNTWVSKQNSWLKRANKLCKRPKKMCLLYNPVIDMTIHIFFSINWKIYFDRSIDRALPLVTSPWYPALCTHWAYFSSILYFPNSKDITLILLVAHLDNTKWCKKMQKWLKPWHKTEFV